MTKANYWCIKQKFFTSSPWSGSQRMSKIPHFQESRRITESWHSFKHWYMFYYTFLESLWPKKITDISIRNFDFISMIRKLKNIKFSFWDWQVTSHVKTWNSEVCYQGWKNLHKIKFILFLHISILIHISYTINIICIKTINCFIKLFCV